MGKARRASSEGTPASGAAEASKASKESRRVSSEPAASGAVSPEPAGSGPASFEAALETLEELVGRLEHGDLPLEEALATFEEGIRLTRHCAARLADAERRLEALVPEGEGWVRRPLGAVSEGSERVETPGSGAERVTARGEGEGEWT